jgi:hypothetical protein
LLAEVSALRVETRGLHEEVAAAVKESQLRGAQETAQMLTVLEHLKQMTEKFDQLPMPQK